MNIGSTGGNPGRAEALVQDETQPETDSETMQSTTMTEMVITGMAPVLEKDALVKGFSKR